LTHGRHLASSVLPASAARYRGQRARWRAGAVVTAALALTLTACGGSSSSSSAGGSNGSSGSSCSAPSTVSIGQFTGAGVALTSDIATAKGYYTALGKQCHTTVKIDTFTSAQAMISGVVSGQLTFALFTPSNNILSALQGQKIEDLMTLGQGGGGVLLASTKNKSRGTGLQALKNYASGTSWALPSLKTATEATCRALLAAVGADASKVQFANVGIAGAGSAVVSGKADIGWATAPQAAQLIASGQAYSVFNTGGTQELSAVGFQPAMSLQALPSTVAKYPQLVQAMVQAHLQSLLFIQANIHNAKAVYDLEPSSYRASTSLATFQQAWKYNVGFFAPATGLLTNSDIKGVGTFMQKYGIISASQSLPTIPLGNSFVTKAYTALGKTVPTTAIDRSILTQIPNS
jgi:ABC-type nitrate/sulfonate/bicarbonate transport system substrate-binding protein